MSGAVMTATDSEQPNWVEKTDRLGAAIVTLSIFLLLAAEVWISARQDTGGNQTFTSIVELTKSLAMLAAGYWMGSSKSSSDKTQALIRQTATPTTTTVVEPAKATTTTAPTPVVQPGTVA